MGKLIGITGFATSGKDTFFKYASSILSKDKLNSRRVAFADALKSELDPLLMKNLNISSFTSDKEEKELIRPLLVTYGTYLRRKLDPDCWIKSIKSDVSSYLSNGDVVFITDIRFKNEAYWVKSEGGCLINIERSGIGPANKDEEGQQPLIDPYVDYYVQWETFGESHLDDCNSKVLEVLNKIID